MAGGKKPGGRLVVSLFTLPRPDHVCRVDIGAIVDPLRLGGYVGRGIADQDHVAALGAIESVEEASAVQVSRLSEAPGIDMVQEGRATSLEGIHQDQGQCANRGDCASYR